jgi:hypothetical protein
VAVAAFFPVALLFFREQKRAVTFGFVLLFLVEGILFLPEAIYAAQNWEWFNGRAKVVAIFNSDAFLEDPPGIMLEQLERNLRGPWDGRVNSTPQYFPMLEPQLDPITGAFTCAGMILTLVLARLRGTPETWLWWLMLLCGWGLTQLLTTNTPNGARGIGYMPTLIYFAAVSLDMMVAGIRRAANRLGTTRRFVEPLGLGALAVIVLGVGAANLQHYVDWQSSRATRAARYLYVTAKEFPSWSARVAELAQKNERSMNVGQWRKMYPIADKGAPPE